MTNAEQKFYNAFIKEFEEGEKHKQLLFPQFSIRHNGKRYVADFFFKPDVVIEIDNKEHWLFKGNRKKDYLRERDLISLGYIVIRFTNDEVEKDPVGCVNEFVRCLSGFEIKYLPKNSIHEKIIKERDALRKIIEKANAALKATPYA